MYPKVPYQRLFARLLVELPVYEVAMKACPRCDVIYNHELLLFCRFDGTRLVNMYSGEETTQLLSPLPISNPNKAAHVEHHTSDLQNRAR